MLYTSTKVARLCHYAACVVILLLVLVTTADVLARYVLASSVPDATEISGMLLGICIALSLPFVTLQEEQVRFDMVVGALAPRRRAFADMISHLIAACMFALLGWQAAQRALASLSSAEFIGQLEIPVWPTKTLFALSCGLTALVLLFLAASAFVKIRKT